MKNYFTLLFASTLFFALPGFSQLENTSTTQSKEGWMSLGGRSTLSAFDHDGIGLGTGGQFRIQLSNRVNTDWFADYITINVDDKVRSEYFHIGWSVLFYPFEHMQFPKLVQPYIVAGHCFDYNKKTVISDPTNTRDRWGSAVQAGLGMHFNLSKRFDVSLTSQYMIHFTKALEVTTHEDGDIHIHDHEEASLEGHVLTTVSLNYKLFRLWKR